MILFDFIKKNFCVKIAVCTQCQYLVRKYGVRFNAFYHVVIPLFTKELEAVVSSKLNDYD